MKKLDARGVETVTNQYYRLTVTNKCLRKLLKYLKNHNYDNYHYYDDEPNKADSLIIVEIYAYDSLKPYKNYLKKYALKVEMV